MPWACQAGATLLIPSGVGNHLFVILNSPTDYPNYPPQSCVLVSFSTIRTGPYDATRIVQAGTHPFVQVDSYHTPAQKEVFESWVLTAEFHDYPDGWVKLFQEAGYTGDWYWTIIE